MKPYGSHIMIDFEQYLSAIPQLHTWDEGATWTAGGFNKGMLKALIAFLRDNLPPAPAILETGAGNTTISFLFLKPSRLVSIAPDPGLFERLRAYCESNAIPTDALEMKVDGSEWVLPQMTKRNAAPQFDLVLIDGSHNWPMVFLDFFFANYMLKPGGYLVLTALQLHPIKELARLLAEQPGFKVALKLKSALMFQRAAEARELPKWTHCPYLVRMSAEYAKKKTPAALSWDASSEEALVSTPPSE